jgi:hypothetical protein
MVVPDKQVLTFKSLCNVDLFNLVASELAKFNYELVKPEMFMAKAAFKNENLFSTKLDIF